MTELEIAQVKIKSYEEKINIIVEMYDNLKEEIKEGDYESVYDEDDDEFTEDCIELCIDKSNLELLEKVLNILER